MIYTWYILYFPPFKHWNVMHHIKCRIVLYKLLRNIMHESQKMEVQAMFGKHAACNRTYFPMPNSSRYLYRYNQFYWHTAAFKSHSAANCKYINWKKSRYHKNKFIPAALLRLSKVTKFWICKILFVLIFTVWELIVTSIFAELVYIFFRMREFFSVRKTYWWSWCGVFALWSYWSPFVIFAVSSLNFKIMGFNSITNLCYGQRNLILFISKHFPRFFFIYLWFCSR